MNNAQVFNLPLLAKIVTENEQELLESRRRYRMRELAKEGWKPRKGWSVEQEHSDAPRPS